MWTNESPAFIATPLLVDHPNGKSQNGLNGVSGVALDSDGTIERNDDWSGHRSVHSSPFADHPSCLMELHIYVVAYVLVIPRIHSAFALHSNVSQCPNTPRLHPSKFGHDDPCIHVHV